MSAPDFSQLKIDELRKTTDITFVNKNSTVAEALAILYGRDLYSVPVFDPESKKYIGLFDLIDAVAFLLELFYKSANVHSAKELSAVVSSQFKKDLEGISHQLQSAQVKDLIDKSGQNAFLPCAEGTLISQVISHLATETRRIPIVDNSGNITQMVSQADIVRYVHSHHMKSLEHKLQEHISKYAKKCIDIDPSTRTLDCFAIMKEAKISALPIVDKSDSNMLVGVVSLKDIKAGLEDMKQLFIPIEDYIAHIRQKNIGTLREFPFISMQATDTLEKAINKMIAVKIHRIYVKKSGTQDVYVLTLKDILHALVTKH